MSNFYQPISKSQLHWTDTAIECYQNGCRCSECLLYEVMGDKCKMKQTVIELVRTIGIPTVKNVESESEE